MSVWLRIRVLRFRQLSPRFAIASPPRRGSDRPGHAAPQELAHALLAEPSAGPWG